jgi:U3 small nucleolar RNA-associated protein 14
MPDKISIADLVQFQDGDKIDIEGYRNDSAYVATRSEVEKLMELKRIKRRPRAETTGSFYELAPKSALEKSINKILYHKEEEPAVLRARAHFKYEFDKKMSRIKRIKSKSYRRIRRLAKRKEEGLAAELQAVPMQPAQAEQSAALVKMPDLLLRELEEDKEETPIFSFAGPSEPKDVQEEMVRLAFSGGTEDNERDFVKEKEGMVNEEAPRIKETVLPGWGSWAGVGMEVIKTRLNTTVECKAGVKYSSRKDFNRPHVIINEKVGELDKKYRAVLPYGYNEGQYQDKIKMPISKEWNALKIFKKLVEPRADGEIPIRQLHYGKEDREVDAIP